MKALIKAVLFLIPVTCTSRTVVREERRPVVVQQPGRTVVVQQPPRTVGVQEPRPNTGERREDWAERREDAGERREDAAERREDVKERREDKAERREDWKENKEDKAERREDRAERREDMAADNTGRNERDRSGGTMTSGDQGENESDMKITQKIRKQVMKNDSLSFSAKNVKIITINGVVTLRGPVSSDKEKHKIGQLARAVAGVKNVNNDLEINK